MPSLERQAEDTVVSVNFYYTPAFAWYTADPVGYVQGLVTSTNVGYANSQVPLRIEAFCVQLLEDFNESATLNSADIAILLLSSSKSGVCGVAYVDGFAHGATFGWVGKGCQNTVTGHEIGHMFGAAHNYEISQFSPREGFEYGFRMPLGPLNLLVGGFVTIMR